MAIEENIFLKFKTSVDGGALDNLIDNLGTAEKLAFNTLEPLVKNQETLNKELKKATTEAQKRSALEKAINTSTKEQARVKRKLNTLRRREIVAEGKLNVLIEKRKKLREQSASIREFGTPAEQAKFKRQIKSSNDAIDAQTRAYDSLSTRVDTLKGNLEGFKVIQEDNIEQFVALGGSIEDTIGKSEELAGSFLRLSSGNASGKEILSTISNLTTKFGALGLGIGGVAAVLGSFFTQFQNGKDLFSVLSAGVGGFSSSLFAELGRPISALVSGNFKEILLDPIAAAARIAAGTAAATIQAKAEISARDLLLTQDSITETLTRNSILLQNQTLSAEEQLVIIRESSKLQNDSLDLRLKATNQLLAGQKIANNASRIKDPKGEALVSGLQRQKELEEEIAGIKSQQAQNDRQLVIDEFQVQAKAISNSEMLQRATNRRIIKGKRIVELANEENRIASERALLQRQIDLDLITTGAAALKTGELFKAENKVKEARVKLAEDELMFTSKLAIETSSESQAVQDLNIRLEDNLQIRRELNKLLLKNRDNDTEQARIKLDLQKLDEDDAALTAQIQIENINQQARVQEAFFNESIINESIRHAVIKTLQIDASISTLKIQRDLETTSTDQKKIYNDEILNLTRERHKVSAALETALVDEDVERLTAFINASIDSEIQRTSAILDIQIDAKIKSLEIQRDLETTSLALKQKFNNDIEKLEKERVKNTAKTLRELLILGGSDRLETTREGTIERREALGAGSQLGDAFAKKSRRISSIKSRQVNIRGQIEEQEGLKQTVETVAKIKELRNDLKEADLDLKKEGQATSLIGKILGLETLGDDNILLDLGLKQAEESIVGFVDNFLAEKVRQADGDIAIQERRVNRAERLLAKGNSDSINAEEEKLDKLLEIREKALQRQRQLAALQIAASNAVAFANTIEGITAALKPGPPAAFIAVPLMIALIAQVASAGLAINSAFGDVPAFFGGTDENIAGSLGSPHFAGRDGYLVRVDGREKVLNPEFSDMVSHMSQAELVDNALRGERMALSDAFSMSMGVKDTNSSKELLKETKKMNEKLDNMAVNVKLDRHGFSLSQQKRIDRINRIKRIRK